MPAIRRMRGAAALPVMLTFVLVASMVALASPADAASRRQNQIWHGLNMVRNQVGDPYRYGAEGPNRFDCSGLIYFSYRQKAGFRRIPRVSSDQARFMNRIKRRNMRKGDFVFFYEGRARARNVYHLGVFVGWKNGRRRIIHAPYGGQTVHRSKIWTNNWFPGTLRGL